MVTSHYSSPPHPLQSGHNNKVQITSVCCFFKCLRFFHLTRDQIPNPQTISLLGNVQLQSWGQTGQVILISLSIQISLSGCFSPRTTTNSSALQSYNTIQRKAVQSNAEMVDDLKKVIHSASNTQCALDGVCIAGIPVAFLSPHRDSES